MNPTSPQLTPDGRLHFQVSLDDSSPRVLHLDQPGAKPVRLRNSGKEVLAGLGRVQLFGRAPGPWTIAWYDYEAGPRHRSMRSTYRKAESLFNAKETELRNRAAGIKQLNPAEAANYLRWEEKATQHGLTVELILDRYLAFRKDLPDIVTDAEVKQTYLDARPHGYTPRPSAEVVADFLEQKRDQISAAWHNALEICLERLAEKFPSPLRALQSAELNTWLRELKDKKGRALGARARHNHRAAVLELVTWAKANNQLPRTWFEMDHVADPGTKMGTIKIWQPDFCHRLLLARLKSEQEGRARAKTMLPFLALQMFAGIRHEELARRDTTRKERLDWRDVHVKERWLHIKVEVSKTGIARTVPIPDNLAAWLAPYVKPSGAVCTLDTVSSALTRAKHDAGLPGGKNQSKNILRKTWTSYRLAIVKHIGQVAEEAGNSPGIIRKHYRAILPPGFANSPTGASAGASADGKRTEWPLEPDARDYFRIMPPERDPLFAWAEKKSKTKP